MIKIDPTARVSPMADIEDSVRGTLIEIGARVMIDSFVKIKPTGGSGDGAGCGCNGAPPTPWSLLVLLFVRRRSRR